MLYRALSCKQLQKKKLVDCSITDISYKNNTSIICASTDDGRIILTSLNQNNNSSPQILTPMDNISKVKWINNYEFVSIGNNNLLYRFSIMNLSCEMHELESIGINSLDLADNILYIGSNDGKITFWDFEQKNMIGEINHKIRSKTQPIKAILSNSNYLYSSTLYKGRVWAWDIRSTNKPISCIETNNVQNSFIIAKETLYSISDCGILRISPNLSLHEYFYKEINVEMNPQSNLEYLIEPEIFIWNRKHKLEIKSHSSHITLDSSNINGFVICNDNIILTYHKTGLITINEVCESYSV